jgi:hypothetical protein
MLLDTSDKLLRERCALMTSKTRREFTGEFKREAVLLLESSGRPPMQVAKEFGTQPSMLRNWRARGPGPAGAGNILLPASELSGISCAGGRLHTVRPWLW